MGAGRAERRARARDKKVFACVCQSATGVHIARMFDAPKCDMAMRAILACAMCTSHNRCVRSECILPWGGEILFSPSETRGDEGDGGGRRLDKTSNMVVRMMGKRVYRHCGTVNSVQWLQLNA